jgi:hypothetical protein
MPPGSRVPLQRHMQHATLHTSAVCRKQAAGQHGKRVCPKSQQDWYAWLDAAAATCTDICLTTLCRPSRMASVHPLAVSPGSAAQMEVLQSSPQQQHHRLHCLPSTTVSCSSILSTSGPCSSTCCRTIYTSTPAQTPLQR